MLNDWLGDVWPALLVLGIWLIMGLALLWWGWRGTRRKGPRCPKCGYDMTGNLTAGNLACPECGKVTKDMSRLVHRRKRRVVIGLAALLLLPHPLVWRAVWVPYSEMTLADRLRNGGHEVKCANAATLQLCEWVESNSGGWMTSDEALALLRDCRADGLGNRIVHVGLDEKATADDIRGAVQCRNLVHFSCASPELNAEHIEWVSTQPQVEAVYLCNGQVTDNEVALIAKMPQLRSLGLRNMPVTNQGIAHLAGTQIDHYDFSGTKVDMRGLQKLRPKYLAIDAKALARGQDLNTTVATTIVEIHLWPEEEHYLKGLKPMAQTLKAIILSGQSEFRRREAIGNGQLNDVALSAMPLMPGVLEIIGDWQVTDKGLEHLRKSPKLMWFPLAGGAITDAGLAQIANCPNLRYLDLSDTKVTDASMPHIGKLWGVWELDLSNTAVTDAGIEHLAGQTQLKKLNLDATPVGDEGMVHLAKLTSLRELHLTGTKVSDAGLVHLAKLTALEELSLGETAVTDVGVAKLAPLSNLRLLDLTDTPVSDAAVDQLHRRLPSTDIWCGRTIEIDLEDWADEMGDPMYEERYED